MKSSEIKDKVREHKDKKTNWSITPSKKDQPVFAKSPEEKQQAKLAKKKHNKFLQENFGTKRPSAGVVKRRFDNE